MRPHRPGYATATAGATTASVLARTDRAHRTGGRLAARFGRFSVVGALGVVVNSIALLVLYQGLHLPLMAATLTAVEVAIIHNFVLDNRWTFGQRHLSLRRFAGFQAGSLGTLVITALSVQLLVEHVHVYYLTANLIGISVGAILNYAVSAGWIWRKA
jgi:putative flippase GtrA